MLINKVAILGLCALGFVSQAHAASSARKLPGYACMMLSISEQQSMDPRFHVVVKSKPAASSSTIGWQPAIVFVKEPEVASNGYLQILRANGQTGWVEASLLKPYHAEADPNAKCAPEILPNGRIVSGPG